MKNIVDEAAIKLPTSQERKINLYQMLGDENQYRKNEVALCNLVKDT